MAITKLEIEEKEKVSCDYSIAQVMARPVNVKNFGVKEWWIDAEQNYNALFGTMHSKLQNIFKGDKLEIKCPAPSTKKGIVPPRYKAQMQGNLLVTGSNGRINY